MPELPQPEIYRLLEGFHAVGGQELQFVWRIIEEGSVTAIVLKFEKLSLVVEAQEDFDTVDVHVEEENGAESLGKVAASGPPWISLIGRKFAWGWITMNQQGYCDGVILSFDEITPKLLLTVAASSIYESNIENPPHC